MINWLLQRIVYHFCSFINNFIAYSYARFERQMNLPFRPDKIILWKLKREYKV